MWSGKTGQYKTLKLKTREGTRQRQNRGAQGCEGKINKKKDE
jgi:hypothetical protein